MGRGHLFDLIPLWLTFVGMVAIVLLSIYGGWSLARFRTRRLGKDEETPVSTVVAATIGLLGFLLAFTFGVTASRFDARKDLLLDEVNAIETTFLRTRLILEPHGAAVRALLKEYVDIRVELARHPENIEQTIQRSEQLQGLMWSHAAALAEANLKNQNIAALFVDSLNQMFDLQTKRVTVSTIHRLPPVMWVVLLALTLLSMLGVGYLFGMSGKANWLLALVLSLAFSSVTILNLDLDRSGARRIGLIKVDTQPMIDLQRRIAGQMTEG
jgi:hypothetical protein